MKKIFLILSIIALSVSCTSKYEDDVVELGNRIDKLEQKIPTIEQQISAIDESITLLKQTDEALRAKDEQLATEDEKLNMAIQELEILITDLEKYVIYPGLNSTKDWAEATFYTLKQYNAAVSTLAKLEQSIASNDDATSKEISDAISALQASFQTWVGKELSGYYSIARADAEFAALRQSIESGDQTLQGEIDAVESQIANSATELEKEYQAAIETAIEEYNGTITAELKSQLDDVNKRIDEQVAAINDKLDALEAQIGKNSEDIAKLLNRIQSLSYVHKYADGKAKMVCTSDYYSSRLSFEVSPKDAVTELEKVWKDIVSAKALGQGVGEEQFVSLPVQLVEADAQSGIITLQLSDTKLPAPIAAASEEIQVAVQISDGNTAIVSDYIPVVKSKIEGDVFIYTTKDGNIFEPIADAFDANIVSNTYDEGIGIIVFDAPITTIGFSAFKGCSSLTSVTIPDSVTEIGWYAFKGCSSLTSVTIGDSVTEIGNWAFLDCSSLTSVTIPDSVTEIGNYAFKGCSSLTSVTIGDSVTEIGSSAFSGCSSLTSFYGKFASGDNRCLIVDGVLNFFAPANLTSYTIPDSVITIGESAFSGCSSLTSVTIPDSVTSIGGSAFNGCSGELIINSKIVETDYSYNNYPMYNSRGWLYGAGFTKLTIGDSVTKIGNYAFSGCSSLTSITIPDSVTSIGDYAFEGCSSLTSITIPDSVTSIGDYAFEGCSSLTSITIPDSVTSIGDHAFEGCTSLKSVTIPDSVTEIGYSTFRGCTSLTSVTIPDSVTEIGWYAFKGCSSLTSVTIGKGVTSIRGDAFSGCSSLTSFYGKFASGDNRCLIVDGVLNFFAPANLTSYTIPDSVTSIGGSAFNGCSSLTSVTIPDSVTSIGGSAFYGCSSLTSVTIPDSVTSIGGDAFKGCSGELIINSKIVETDYTSNNYPMYYLYDGWLCGSKFTKLTIGDSVTKIGKYAFSGCSSLTSITIPDSVTSIGDYAFKGCSSLTSVTIGKGVTSIGGDAFEGCTGELIINSKIVETDYTSDDYPSKYYGWLYGSKFTKLTIGDSVTKIGKRVFYGCSSLTSVTIPNSVTTIGSYAFSGCTGELIINSKIVETNYSSSSNYDGWHEGSNFTKLTIGDSVTKIGNYAFYGCSSLTSVTIPDSVTSIGESAFSGCSSLKSVNITDLSAWCKIVFGDVSANPLGYAKKLYLDGMEVTKITIPSDITKIKPYTFYGCCSLKNVTIHNRVTSIGSYAFSGCSSLTSVTIPNSVTSIGGSAFYGCGSLTSVTIPNSVTSIGKRVFYGCSGELIINSKIVETDYTSNNYPMYNHYDGWLEGSNFTKLTIGDSVTKIGNYAFSGCSSLTSITIPDSVTSIGKNAFHYCRNLTSVTIPDNVTKIGGSAFSSCYSLTSVYCKPTTPPAGGDYMFSSNGSVRNIYVPRNSLSKYESAKYWCDYIDYIVGYDF